MAEGPKANVEEMDVPGREVQKIVSKLVLEPKVSRVTLFDKAGEVLLDVPVSDPAYKGRAMRSVMPSMVNTLGLIAAKVPEVKVKVEREQ